MSELKNQLEPDTVSVANRPTCLEGTCVAILEEITGWSLNISSQRILWLHGAAGSGKTTLARSIQERMRPLSKLGAYLRFERGKSQPETVIRTVAYQLACFDPRIADSMSRLLGNSQIQSLSLQSQFQLLLEQSLESSGEFLSGPVVIILDALDECGNAASRKELLQLLCETPKLPANFRLLITSRPESDIQEALLSISTSQFVYTLELDCNSAGSRDNVTKFLDHELSILAAKDMNSELFPQWKPSIATLASASAGLFIYASTAVKMIEASTRRLKTLQSLVSGRTRPSGVDDLYCVALENSGIEWDDAELTEQFQDIISFLVYCKAPISDEIIDGVLDISPQDSSRLLLDRLRPLIAYAPGRPISFHHVTIRDFFVKSAGTGKPWSVDISSRKNILADQCFSVMEKLLRFNICGLHSSFLSNDEVEGLDDRIEDKIPLHLRYACLHWAQHLADCDCGQALRNTVSEFLYNRLLHWVEVLSLLKQTAAAGKIMADASYWSTEVKAGVACSGKNQPH